MWMFVTPKQQSANSSSADRFHCGVAWREDEQGGRMRREDEGRRVSREDEQGGRAGREDEEGG